MKLHSIAVLVLCLALSACSAKNTVTNTPPGVTSQQVSNWMNASNDVKQAQGITHDCVVNVVALNHATPSVIPDGPGYVAALEGLGRAEQLENEMATFLNTVPRDWSAPTQQKVSDFTTQILAQLNAAVASGVLRVKDTKGVVISESVTNAIRVMQLIQTLKSASVLEPRLEAQLVN